LKENIFHTFCAVNINTIKTQEKSMALITWTASQFGTNVPFADEEHQILFGKLNKLYDLATGGAARSAIGEQLDDLIAYVVGHFAHEEKEMQAKNYAGLAAHKAEHEKLIAVCADLQTKFHAGEAEVTDEVGQMVKGWLNNHIPNVDMPYADALNS
jgi:hemerythrin